MGPSLRENRAIAIVRCSNVHGKYSWERNDVVIRNGRSSARKCSLLLINGNNHASVAGEPRGAVVGDGQDDVHRAGAGGHDAAVGNGE